MHALNTHMLAAALLSSTPAAPTSPRSGPRLSQEQLREAAKKDDQGTALMALLESNKGCIAKFVNIKNEVRRPPLFA